jgi:hypothetical protein
MRRFGVAPTGVRVLSASAFSSGLLTMYHTMKHTPQLSRPTALRVSPKLSAPRALLAAMLVVSSTSVFAANITLSKAFLDSVNGFVNFAKPTLGSGSLAITNNLQPGDTVFIEGQTRPVLTLVNPSR